MKIAKLLAGFVVSAVIFFSCKKEEAVISNTLNDADLTFIKQAGISNYTEAETAKIAVAKATDTIVLSFAQQMLTDYANAKSDLAVMGTIVGFSVKDSIDAAHAETLTNLNVLARSRVFDSTYIRLQLVNYAATKDIYINELSNGSQLNVKGYANANLQIAELHYLRADSIATNLYH